MNPSAVAVIATLSSLYGPQADRRIDRRQFLRVTGGAAGAALATGFLAHPLLQAAVLDRPDDLILLPGDVTSSEPILFQTEMYDLARQFAMLCGQRWGQEPIGAARLADHFVRVGGEWRRDDAPTRLTRNPVTVFVKPNMSSFEWDALLHPAVSQMQGKMLRAHVPSFTALEQLPRIASMDDETVETGIAIDPITGVTARASRSVVAGQRWHERQQDTQTLVQLEIIGRQVGRTT